MTNLLSNAFRYTPSEGSIVLKMEYHDSEERPDGHEVRISIEDSGPGIPEASLDRIFERFYQVDESDSGSSGGTGIGLALTKELVELYSGTITVESRRGEGSRFTVTLPVSKSQFREQDIVEVLDQESSHSPGSEDIFVDQEIDDFERDDLEKDDLEKEKLEKDGSEIVEANIEHSEFGVANNEHGSVLTRKVLSHETISRVNEKLDQLPLLLIVEDNSDLRNYISENLNSEYRILEAENGRDGLQLAINSMPDLIISDLMMPVMDGIELCIQVRREKRTNHIPFIMLTAKADRESKLEGLETGADDYLIKPFDAEELRVRIKNLINQREILKEKFRKEFMVIPDEKLMETSEDSILVDIFRILENHFSDPDFNLEKMSSQLSMSRSTLFRKVRAVTGFTPNELLQNIRLKKAAGLFNSGEKNITRVLYQVGFNTPSYFTECFREQFGMNPSDYIKSISR
jgi:CheY-like chemotaxis protein/AraC-like DNA-binding protein